MIITARDREQARALYAAEEWFSAPDFTEESWIEIVAVALAQVRAEGARDEKARDSDLVRRALAALEAIKHDCYDKLNWADEGFLALIGELRVRATE
jgi:hypothetical protein